MKNKFLFFIFSMPTLLFGQVNVKTVLKSDSLAYEFSILEKTFRELHPRLYRFHDEETMNQIFADAKQNYSKSQNLREAYLNLQRFTTKLQCGHTYPNFWNQKYTTQESLFNQADKLPFTFIAVKNQFLIRQNVSDMDIPENALVQKINGVSTEEIIQKLMEYSRADGGNDLKRIHEMNITGQGRFETFDIYFPMLFPPKNGAYSLKIQDLKKKVSTIEVKTISRGERNQRLQKRFDIQPLSPDDKWEFKFLDDKTAYLKLGTFAIWQMKLKWKAFMKDAFRELAKKNTPYLIIDIRDNEGGMAEVWWELLSYLTDEPMTLALDKKLIRYQKVSDEIRPFVGSWEKNLFDISSKVKSKNLTILTLTFGEKSTFIHQSNKRYHVVPYMIWDEKNQLIYQRNTINKP